MSKAHKTPKATDEIKELLLSYGRFQKRIDNNEERLAFLDVQITANITGMPSGGGDGSSKQERLLLKKEELEEKLRNMYAEENRLREKIEDMIEQMKNPDEQTAIEMHYLDGAKWKAVSLALYGNEPDYDENEERYLKKTFKIHGSALQTLLRIYEKGRMGNNERIQSTANC